jgi:acyl-CoA synthetase (NDP forming)/GNAT superfamily N-acetyltransferase
VRGADILLSDGTAARLRPIEPSDAPAIVAMHSRFSERTRYLRYFSPYPRIPERDLQRFVNVDHHDREAFVVGVGDRLVAVGRYERLGAQAEDAEVAFVVEDAYQGRGVGSILLEHLASQAAREGITRFVAEVLPANGQMLRVFSDAGYQVQRQYADGVVHLTFPIAPTDRSLSVQWSREQRTEARSIARLLAPRGVAVYGASRSGLGAGAAVLAHLRDSGFTGSIVPVHPQAVTVNGLPAHRSLADAPGPVDLAVVAVPSAQVPGVLRDCAGAGVHGLVVISGGYAESGGTGAAEERDLAAAAHAVGMRVVGPNCLGIANTDPSVRLNATLAPRLPARGNVGFFSQSGALGVALLDQARRRGLGLSTFVSAGNRVDVSGNDLLQYWQDDPDTHVVMLYLENFGNARKFGRLVRRLGRDKPVVAVAPRLLSASAVSAGPDVVAQAALFTRSGVIRVDTVAEMFDVGVLLAHQPLPTGPRVGVVTNSAALGVLAAAACPGVGLAVAPGYPVDLGPEVESAIVREALRTALDDAAVDAVVAVCAPALPGTADPSLVEALAEAAADQDKPVVATYLGDEVPPGLPVYPAVEEAVRALGRVAAYADWRRAPVGVHPELSGVDPAAGRHAAAGADITALLAAYGVEVVRSRHVVGVDAAVAAAEEFGYPVAVKAAAGGLRHRQDLGAVRINQGDADAVRLAYQGMARLLGADPEVIVQPMVPPGVPCVVLAVDSPALGPVVGFGLGGVAGELVGDRAWRTAPLTDRDADSLVREPRAAPLLFGYRGAQPADVAALADLLVRIGRLAEEQPRLRRLELNPVLVRPDGLAVLHAEAAWGAGATRPDTGPRRLR